tara:strand:+ start:4378 stop:4884 length:507 start_codon:yes stop_codon:yes gene_type:complete
MVDSTRITASSITKQSFWNLYNLINDRDNVPDPNDSGGNRKFVYRRIPNIGRNFAGFPFIVVSRTRPTKIGNTADLSKKFNSYDFTVTIFSQDSSSDSSGNPSGVDTTDIISNNIINTLDNKSNRKTLIDYGMAHLEYNVDNDEEELDEKTVFTTEFDIRFENNLISV